MVFNTGETSEELKNTYNPEGGELRKAQIRMIEMLQFVDKICAENKIEYFIDSGTLLGAVRHGGFIPWDDDLDICISKKDLKKLTKLINDSTCDYIMQNHKTDKGFLKMWSVLRDKKSEYVKEEYEHNMRKYKGVQCDFFIVSRGVFKSGRALVRKMVHFNERFLLGKHNILSEMLYGATAIVVNILRLVSILYFNNKISYGYESQFVQDYKYNDVFPLNRIKFENIEVSCPHNVDGVLRNTYGDEYMMLPPKENRCQHQVNKIVFFDDEGNILAE